MCQYDGYDEFWRAANDRKRREQAARNVASHDATVRECVDGFLKDQIRNGQSWFDDLPTEQQEAFAIDMANEVQKCIEDHMEFLRPVATTS